MNKQPRALDMTTGQHTTDYHSALPVPASVFDPKTEAVVGDQLPVVAYNNRRVLADVIDHEGRPCVLIVQAADAHDTASVSLQPWDLGHVTSLTLLRPPGSNIFEAMLPAVHMHRSTK